MSEKPRSRAELPATDHPQAPRWVRVLAYIIVGLGVFSFLVCGYVLFLIKPTVSDDPKFAQHVGENILNFTPATGYLPKGAIQWPLLSLLKLEAAYYENKDVDGVLVLIEVRGDQLRGYERVEQHMEAMLRERNGISDALTVFPKVVVETVEVQGREREFELSEAIDPVTKHRYRIIEGTVQSRMGQPVFLGMRYQVPTTKTDEPEEFTRLPDDVRQMLESIR